MGRHVVLLDADGQTRPRQTAGRTILHDGRLSAGRRAYDQRRRRHPLNPEGRQYRDIVVADPCSYCGAPPGEDMAADHIVGLQDGGDNVWDNLTAACRPCNASKRQRKLLLWMLDRRSH